jgi:DUF4097 and DUF4098 domain-containing protein YvlB
MKKALTIGVMLLLAILSQPRYLFAAPDRTIEKSFPVKMGGRLELDLDTGGDIEITGWDRAEIAVVADIGGRDGDMVRVEFEPGSASLRIHSYCEKRRNSSTDVDFTLKVPNECDIRIDSNGGGVEITGVAGEIRGKTMGGSLELARIKGEIHLETMGGSVRVEDSEADGKVSTMGGSVLIRNVKGNLRGSTMGGKVTYTNVTGGSASSKDEEMQISTMGGDIVVGKTGGKVHAETYGGDIDVGEAKAVDVTTMGGDINVDDAPSGAKVMTMGGDITIRSAGNYVKAKTMGGDIDIDSIDGEVEATTMGGDIAVTMTGDPKKGERDVELSSMGGDIELTVPAGLSMKFDLEIEYTKNCRKQPRIESDFKMNIEETKDWERHHGSARKHIYGTGSVGGGEHLIRIKTINGNITIKKAS